MSDVNVVVLNGRLCKDPESRKAGENSVCSFRIANNMRFSQDKERNLFIDVEVWGKQGENCQKYLSKGKQVSVTGSLRLDQWGEGDKKQSKTYVSANDVQFLGGKDDGEEKTETVATPAPVAKPPTTGTKVTKPAAPKAEPATAASGDQYPF